MPTGEMSRVDPARPTSSTETETRSPSDDADGPQYTIFTRSQKRAYSLILGFLTLASPLTATIYFPLLPLLQNHFNTSPQAINLTLTLYLVFQGLSPLLFAPPSDVLGRRPIFLGTFALYTVSSLGLALNKSSYAALLVLRALQSIGASAVLAVAYGTIADLAVPAERGKMLGAVMAASNLGPCIGPLIGGVVAWGSGSFQWAFWTLVIFGGLAVGAIGWGLPETGRRLVGNGEVPPEHWWNLTWWSLLTTWRTERAASHEKEPRGLENGGRNERKTTAADSARNMIVTSPVSLKASFRASNPLTCLRIIFHRDTALALWMSVSFYTVWYTIQASIPPIFERYGYNELVIGLCFLPGGLGVVVGGIVTGRIMDWNYRRTALEAGLALDRGTGDDMSKFPIEKARGRAAWGWLALFAGVLTGFGWAVEKHTHPAVPLTFQFILAFVCTYFFQVFNSLLVDIFPEKPSTAAAAGNISRCALSGVAVAILQPLVDALGYGWFFTLFSVLTTLGNFGALALILAKSRKWREMRLARGVHTEVTRDGSCRKQDSEKG
jgi:MFS family permease